MAYQSVYLGKQIGNYQIVSAIASGSFGSVFLAQHLFLKQRSVVIKILHAIHLGSAEEKEQFLQEAQILELLKGVPHVLPLLDVGIDGDTPYLITEYAEQGSLRMRMRQQSGPFSTQEALAILAQVAQGLQVAHDRNIVHRDLKPENILFNARGEALLADFGISTVLSTASVKYTQDVVGTPAYMAPEQFRGEVSKESDQYALACIAYELLTTQKPFNAADFVAMGFLHTSETPVPPSGRNMQVSANVDQAILKALSKKRTERYTSVSEFIHALQQQSAQPRKPLVLPPPPEPPIAPTIYATPSQVPPVQPAARVTPRQLPSNPQLPVPLAQPSSNNYGYGPAPQSAGAATTFEPYQGNMSSPYASANPYQGQGYTPQQQQLIYSPPVQQQLPYRERGLYGVPNAADNFFVINGDMRLLSGLCYLVPVLSGIIYFIGGRKNRFARFHFWQAVFSWLLLAVSVTFSTKYPVIGVFFYAVFIFMLIAMFAGFLGKYFKMPFIGNNAEVFAQKNYRP